MGRLSIARDEMTLAVHRLHNVKNCYLLLTSLFKSATMSRFWQTLRVHSRPALWPPEMLSLRLPVLIMGLMAELMLTLIRNGDVDVIQHQSQ